MSTTTDNQNFIDESTVPYSSVGIKYGTIAALISVILGLVMYMADMMDPANNVLSTLIQLVVFVGGISMAIKEHREEDLNGFISFKRAFGVGFIAVLAIAVISAIWTYVFMAFIAPDMMDMIKEVQMQAMADRGMEEDEIEAGMEAAAMFMSPGAIASMGIIFSLIMGSIIAAITSAIMKNDSPIA